MEGSESQQCDTVSGMCSCIKGYQGFSCDQCVEGFYNFPNCKECACNRAGVIDDTCDACVCECDGVGQCFCKVTVIQKSLKLFFFLDKPSSAIFYEIPIGTLIVLFYVIEKLLDLMQLSC